MKYYICDECKNPCSVKMPKHKDIKSHSAILFCVYPKFKEVTEDDYNIFLEKERTRQN